MLCCLAAVFICLCLRAGVPSAGIYNSFKGIGVTAQFNGASVKDMHIAHLFGDFYGVPTGRAREVGIKFNYTRAYVFSEIPSEECIFKFYAGPGASLGYVRDYEHGYYENLSLHLKNNPGGMTSLSGTAGCIVDFSKKIFINLSWTAELGIHVRRNATTGKTELNWYKNGIFQALYPQLSIMTEF